MKFEIRYSRKIRDAVAVFTIFMFICQYGLTREDVAENFSRTAPTASWFYVMKKDELLSAINTGAQKERGAVWYAVGRYVYVPLAAVLCCVALFRHVAF